MTNIDLPAVRTNRVWKVFEQEAEEVTAVRDVSLTIARGEFTALAGPSGSGKTTLLNVIGGLTRATRGQVDVAGQDISEMTNQELARLRLEQVGFVFQAYNLLPVLTALENAEFPMLLQGIDAEERRARVQELFHRTGMDGLEDRRPGKLSGGQQQRVAVARAVAGQPSILLADEPTGNLDGENSEEVLRALQTFSGSGGSVLLVTHDPEAVAFANRTVTLENGQVARDQPGGAGTSPSS